MIVHSRKKQPRIPPQLAPLVWAARPVLDGPGPLAPITCQRPRWREFGESHATCPVTRSGGITPALHSAYAAWAEHHATCSHCRSQDWWMPGAPVRITEGEHSYYRYAPDVAVLCKDGRACYNEWSAQAASSPRKEEP